MSAEEFRCHCLIAILDSMVDAHVMNALAVRSMLLFPSLESCQQDQNVRVALAFIRKYVDMATPK
jgi:hypothetical protein